MIHRDAFDQDDIYQDAIPVRSYNQDQVKAVIPGEIMQLEFDLLPTSYLVKKDHQIRISIAGADKDFFAINANKAPKFKIYHSEKYNSQIILPIVP